MVGGRWRCGAEGSGSDQRPSHRRASAAATEERKAPQRHNLLRTRGRAGARVASIAPETSEIEEEHDQPDGVDFSAPVR